MLSNLQRRRVRRTLQPVECTQEDPIGLAGGLNLYGFANGDPVNFNDPFGLAAEVIAEDVTVLRVIAYLRENSTTFRELYDKLHATKKYTVFIDRREGRGNTHDGRTDGVSIINFDVGQINDFNAEQGSDPAWIMTAAAALAHEVGHAGGEAGFLPQHCGSDPAGGYGGCIIDFENKIRSELPQNAQGGRRPHY